MIRLIIEIVAIVIILYVVTQIVVPTEKNDLHCPQGPYTKNKSLCKEGNGKTYSGSHPESNDTTNVLLSKIKIAALAGRKDVSWRRSFIASCIICLLVFAIVLRKIPSVAELLGVLFVCTTVMYAIHSFYNYHHYAHIEGNIIKSINILQLRLKDKPKNDA